MSINTFMKIAGAVAILFGIAWLVIPRFMADTYGVKTIGDAILGDGVVRDFRIVGGLAVPAVALL